jgi:hypothetical protein
VRKTRTGKKDQPNSRASGSPLRKLPLTVLFMVICFACAVSRAATSKLYPPTKDEAGTLRVAQIVNLATREEILKLGAQLKNLLASGLKDSDFKDGSLASGRIYCCHPKTEEGTAVWFYVPPDVPVQLGDIAVVRMGHESTKTDPGAVNMLVEVREKKDAPDSQCSWDPPDNTKWTRVLYCKWMPAEGWTLKKGLYKTWLKRDSNAKAQ